MAQNHWMCGACHKDFLTEGIGEPDPDKAGHIKTRPDKCLYCEVPDIGGMLEPMEG
jgi:hypothetical protein